MARFIVVAPLLSSPPEPQSIELQAAGVSLQPQNLTPIRTGESPLSFPEAEGWGAQATVA